METLKKNKEFNLVYNQGKSIASKYLVLYYYNKNDTDQIKAGFSISKRIGKAVVRNKLRRRLKEIIRDEEDNLKKGYNIIFIARKPVINLDFHKIKKDVKKLFKKADLYVVGN